ncbi:hypothetical protein SCUCBS95973_003181 [Sporothrix curviconia]|uniref:Uncharacterized protein n=1 Tax=Sporothrix curviconia TaxID=1260050 RepID=A0ABP0BDE9_9PEZI
MAPTERQYVTRSKGTNTNPIQTSNTTQRKPLPYCSQACILDLRSGGAVDHDCPNARLHPTTDDGCHTLTAVQFCSQLRAQLVDDLDENCDALDKFGKFGAIGMLFRLTLEGFGYCVWRRGKLIPVCLGIIHLVDVYRKSFGAHISHMLIISYGGEPIGSKAARPLPDNIESLEYNLWARLRQLGVDHGDEREPNVLWNAPQQVLMCIDFERSKIMTKKRKHGAETHPPSKSLSPETRRLLLT